MDTLVATHSAPFKVEKPKSTMASPVKSQPRSVPIEVS